MDILRPKVQLLDENHKKEVIEEAKDILYKLGVFIENKQAAALLSDQGVKNENQRYYIPHDLVEKCLKTVPNEITFYDREGNYAFTLKDDRIHFDPGSAAIFILDENTGKIREPLLEDFIRFTQIVDQCNNIEAQSTAIVYSDVPKQAQDWHRLFTALRYSHKPVVTGTFRKESFKIMKDLLLVCRNSEEDLKNKPLAIFDACPSPPLNWSDLTTQSVIDAALSGIPSEFISMPMAGSTSPITIIGSVTQAVSENLAGVVISQLAKEESPVIWGGSPSVMDMRYGTTPMGDTGTFMINLCSVEIGKFLGMPTHAYMGLSDSKILDYQAGMETSMGALLAGLSGINMISGLGMLDFESCQSIEKLIIDNEIAGMIKHFTNGVQEHEKPYASKILADFYNRNELLSHPTTLSLFRKEHYIVSPLIARMTRNEWEDKGSLPTRKRAFEMIPKLIKKESSSPINESIAIELEKIAKTNLK
ncbi:MAG: trimethylamine methyltransferase family protein [Candidatus Thorarchaeota archaeon]